MIKILYSADPVDWVEYELNLHKALDQIELDYQISTTYNTPEEIDYIIYAPDGTVQDFNAFTNLKLVQNLWAGVEVPTANKTLTQPLARMVEPGLTLGMADYVMGHVLRHHLGTDKFSNARPGEWLGDNIPALAQDRMVGVLGLGELGLYCAQKIADFGFQTCGWSRTQKTKNINIECYNGTKGLDSILAKSDILVLLLPNTPETNHIIDADNIAKMRDGVAIINPGRGTLINDTALLNALNSGKVASATLDVFQTEPLPADHLYWTHSNVLVTPHIASSTRINTACNVIAENIRRGENNEPFLYLVDKSVGY